jgi:transposase-like protein
MIIDYKVNYNNYSENILNNNKFFNYECPKCGNKHSWNRHGSYNRNLTIVENNSFIDTIIIILRLKCTSCNSTHAILPSNVIPYHIYSFSSTIKILLEHYEENLSVLSIAKKYNISFQLIYFILNIYISFINEYIYTLRILNVIKGTFIPTAKKLLSLITNQTNYYLDYSKMNKWPFFMTKFRNKHSISIFIEFNYLKIYQPT